MSAKPKDSRPAQRASKAKLAAAACCAGLTLGAAYPFSAQAMGQCCGETALLSLILETMQANFEMLYMYMISGEGDVGTGIVGTTSANAQSQMSHDEAAKSNLQAHRYAIKREQQGEKIAVDRNVRTLGDPRECSEAKLRSDFGVRGDNADAYAASMSGAAKIQQATAKARALPNESASAGEVLAAMGKYCSPADAAAQRCSKSSLPDANVRAESLFKPAGDYTAPVQSQSLTYDNGSGSGEQMSAAQETASNILGRFAPAALPQAVAQTPAGKMHTAKVKIYEARLSPAENILTGIAGRRAPMPSSQAWSQASDEYPQIFPNTQKPSNPSEIEALRYEVMRRYAGSKWQSDVKKSGDLASALRERVVTESVELKVLYDIHTRLEEQASVRAAILAQLVGPVDRKSVEDAGSAAYRTKQ